MKLTFRKDKGLFTKHLVYCDNFNVLGPYGADALTVDSVIKNMEERIEWEEEVLYTLQRDKELLQLNRHNIEIEVIKE